MAKWSRKANGVLIGFLLVAGFFLLTEHRAHLLAPLPLILLLACLLMHLLMRHGESYHGDRSGHGRQSGRRSPS